LRREIHRKVIHLASVAVPLLVWWVPRGVALAVLVPTAAVALLIEGLRLSVRSPRYLFLRRTRTMLRARERRRLTGATYMASAYALAVLLFPTPVAVLAMLYNGVGDAVAALVGKRWGRHRLRSGKSWEGMAAGFSANLALGLLLPGIPSAPALAGALAASLLELADLPPDDNLWVTLGGGAVLWGTVLLAS
jgi:dolichol kinase